MEKLHESKWNEQDQCFRLVHPNTGDFIAEYYPNSNQLVVTKHRQTAIIDLDLYKGLLWTQLQNKQFLPQ